MDFYNVIYRFICQLESRKKLLSSSPESISYNPAEKFDSFFWLTNLELWKLKTIDSIALEVSVNHQSKCTTPIDVSIKPKSKRGKYKIMAHVRLHWRLTVDI